MILRVWRAAASEAGATQYRQHFETAVRPELEGLHGFEGAMILERAVGLDVEIVVQTRWSSLEAIRTFAGETYEDAVVEPGARAALASFDERVSHYTVVMAVASP